MTASFRDLLRARYTEVIGSVKERWKVLILDDASNRLLFSLFTSDEILSQGVAQIDIISEKRRAQPHLQALYVVGPTSKNVEYILRDYAPPVARAPAPEPAAVQDTAHNSKFFKKKAKPAPEPVARAPPTPTSQPLYDGAHIFFIDSIQDKMVQKLTSALPRTYLKTLTEIYVNLNVVESNVYSLNIPQALEAVYAPDHPHISSYISPMARSIVNALALLGEYPLIRYYESPNPPPYFAGLTKIIASQVQQGIDMYARQNDNFPPIVDPPRERGVVIITDRSLDVNAPILHEFTYQAMIYDLLDIQKDATYKYSFTNSQGRKENKEVKLDDTDEVWLEIRHMHMKDALDKLVKDFQQFSEEHKSNFEKTGPVSLNNMKDMLASLPQLTQTKEKLSLHLSLAEQCMDLFTKMNLPTLASVEQCCSTGETPEGKTPKTLVEEMVPILDDPYVSPVDKVRIIALYIIFRDGVSEEDKTRLFQHARLSMQQIDAINHLELLGQTITLVKGHNKRKPIFKRRSKEDTYDVSRFQPNLKFMLEQQVANKLSQRHFPYIKDAPEGEPEEEANGARAFMTTAASTVGKTFGRTKPEPVPTGSLRSARPQWTQPGGAKVRQAVASNTPRQRLLVFQIGGITYSEIRAASEVAKESNVDIFLGSTDVLTPQSFISSLMEMSSGRGFAHGAMPPQDYHVQVRQAAPSSDDRLRQVAQNNNPAYMMNRSQTSPAITATGVDRAASRYQHGTGSVASASYSDVQTAARIARPEVNYRQNAPLQTSQPVYSTQAINRPIYASRTSSNTMASQNPTAQRLNERNNAHMSVGSGNSVHTSSTLNDSQKSSKKKLFKF